MEKVWELKKQTEKDLITQLLANRGIFESDNIDSFLNVDYAKLHDPFIFKDMAKAVQRILEALAKKEKIVIYSDYDADAITANALLFRLFKVLGAVDQTMNIADLNQEINLEVYIPDRFTEGYGLNLNAFEHIKNSGAKVVITVDCGTNSTEEAKYCNANGIDLIITDHHEITGELPDAFALINPKNPNEQYPYNQLTGVGVAFKFACAVLQKSKDWRDSENNLIPAAQEIPIGYEKWFLDLVAIGTIADCHSLIGENRILVKYGLQVMAKTKWPGLRALLVGAGIDGKPLDAYSVGFIIAPRINAAGRIDHAKGAFDLLVTDDPEDGIKQAKALDALNSRRQMLTETVMSEARAQVALLADKKILLVSGTDWPKGVVGLVAGKLAEEFTKPVLVMERGPLESTGSARSVKNFNVVDALIDSKDLLVKYGGHAAAAGFTLRTENIEAFYKKLLDFAETNMNTDDLVKVIDVDASIKVDDVHLRTIEQLDKFEPFGMDNPKPKFLLESVRIESLNAVGKEGKHLQLSVSSTLENGSKKVLKSIGFNFGKLINVLSVGQQIDVVVELLGDSWQGVRTAKLRMIDYKDSRASS